MDLAVRRVIWAPVARSAPVIWRGPGATSPGRTRPPSWG